MRLAYQLCADVCRIGAVHNSTCRIAGPVLIRRPILVESRHAGRAGDEGRRRYVVELLDVELRATPRLAGVHMMPIFAPRRLEQVLTAAGVSPTDRLAG